MVEEVYSVVLVVGRGEVMRVEGEGVGGEVCLCLDQTGIAAAVEEEEEREGRVQEANGTR